MPQEIKFVWRTPMSFMNACLLINRYGIIAELSVILYLFYLPHESRGYCEKMYLVCLSAFNLPMNARRRLVLLSTRHTCRQRFWSSGISSYSRVFTHYGRKASLSLPSCCKCRAPDVLKIPTETPLHSQKASVGSPHRNTHLGTDDIASNAYATGHSGLRYPRHSR